MSTFEIGTTLYYIKNEHDELPRIEEGMVIPVYQGFATTRLVALEDPKHPGDNFVARLRREYLPFDQVTPDKAIAYQWLFSTIDECIKGLEADIETLREYKREQSADQ